MPKPVSLAQRLLTTLTNDLPRLEEIDNYRRGRQRAPHTPDNADREFRELARRSITNLCQMPTNSVAQIIEVDGFRPGLHGEGQASDGRLSYAHGPQWDFFQQNSLDSRQDAVHRGALDFGHSFVVNEKGTDEAKSRARGLSAMRTTALYKDPANDIVPVAAIYVDDWGDGSKDGRGAATMWDDLHLYKVVFTTGGEVTHVTRMDRHGWTECPVTRFAPIVDLDGCTVGLIEPLIPLQDRLNQTIFDLLVTQSYSSFKVRTVTGMAPPMQTKVIYETDGDGNRRIDPVTREPIVLDVVPVIDPSTGQPKPAPVSMLAKSALWAEDPEVKFGTLDHTPLDGHIAAAKLAVQHFTAIGQVPPHYALGEIANLSAEALDAAQQTLMRLADDIKTAFGESWERVVRLAMRIENQDGAKDMHAEVIWADKDGRAWGSFSDGAGKLVSELGIPQQGLWHRVPGVTQGELARWERLARDHNRAERLAEGVYRPAGGVAEENVLSATGA